MTYQEIKDRLSKCELTLEKLKNGNYTSKEVKLKTEKLNIIRESYLKLLKEADKGVIYTDDEKQAKELSDDGANVKLTKEEEGGVKFSIDETKAIARKVGEAVAKSLKNLGDEVAHMKARDIEENSFEIYVEYKNGNEDQFSFYINEDDALHLTDFSFDKEISSVGVKPSGEAVVNVDVIANELQKHFKSMNEKVDSKDKPELKKLSKALSNSVKAHLDQKKSLDKAINTESDVSEAPEGMYYIKISKDAASQNKAQVIFNDFYDIDYEINDDPDGIIMYFKKDDYDPGVMDDLEGEMVQILDTNIPISEGEKETDDYGRPHVDPKGSRTFLEPDEMLPYNRFKKMAQKEDTDVGHVDDEPDMLQATAYEIATYAAKLSKKLAKYDAHDGEVDFPNWWQAKLILAKDYMSKAFHYLDSEEKQPALDKLALESFIKEGRGDGEAINDIIISMANEDNISTREAAEEIIDHITHIFINTKGKESVKENEIGDSGNNVSMGYENARDTIGYLREKVYPHLNDEELEEFRKTMYDHFKDAVHENVDKVAGGIPYKREGNKFIITEPLDDATKERIIGRAKEHGHHAAPNQAGGVTIMAKGSVNERLSGDARQAIYDLQDILDRAAQLGDEARQIVKDNFPNELSAGEAYDVFSFGTSSNSYDKTLETLISDIERTAEEEDEDMDEDNNPVPQGKHIKVDDMQFMHDQIVSRMKMLAKIYKEKGPEATVMLGPNNDREVKVLDTLKILTKKKRELEDALQNKVAGIGKDQELDEAGPGFKHDCAAKVVHEKYGAGNTIPEKHTLVKEGNKYVVTHYDVLFENGNTVLDIPVNELDIKTTNEHWHKGYKKKKK